MTREGGGVVFCSLEEGRRSHPDVVKRYLGSLVDLREYSSGVFVYVPPGVRAEKPLQADLSAGPDAAFSRTLIVVGENAAVEYLEGCTAPRASKEGRHAGVAEVIALAGARARLTTLQDWPEEVVNEPAKAGIVHAGASLTWVDGNLGSRTTVKRPALRLAGPGASARLVCCAVAGPGQSMTLGGRLVVEAENCSGSLECRGMAWGGGRLDMILETEGPDADVRLRRDVLLLDEHSAARGSGGEASIARPRAEQMFFLANLGLDEAQAKALLAEGFCEPFAKDLPLEFSVEWTRLLRLHLGL